MDIHGYYGSMSVYRPEDRIRCITRSGEVAADYSSFDWPVRSSTSWAEPSKRNPLFSSTLQNICKRTQANLDHLIPSLTLDDACHEYGIKHWHPDKRPQSAHSAREKHPERPVRYPKPKWENHDVMFTGWDSARSASKDDSCAASTTSSHRQINFCYLCSTIEEHEAHMKKSMPLRVESKQKRKERLEKAQAQRTSRLNYKPPPVLLKKKEEERAKPPEEVLYKIVVKTAQTENAGTNAPVFVRLMGKSNEVTRQLKKGKRAQNHVFVKGASDTFYIRSPILGDALKLHIWTESNGNEKLYWILREILVTDVREDVTWYGEYRTHPDPIMIADNIEKEVRGPTKMKLVVKEREEADYEIAVITGKKKRSGTDANVSITLYGRKGVSDKLGLKDRKKKLFDRGTTDLFLVTLPESLGPLSKVRIEHDNSGESSDWFLDKVIVRSLASDKSYIFDCNDWICVDEAGEGALHRFLKVRTGKVDAGAKRSMTNYMITVVTGTKALAGTEAKVYLQILGSETSTGELFLEGPKEKFKKGAEGVFKIPAKDIGQMKKIRIWHDNTGTGPGWFLEKVIIERHLQRPEIQSLLEQQERDGQLPHGITLKNLDKTLDKYYGKKKILSKKKKKKKKVTDDEDDEDDDEDDLDLDYFGLKKKKDFGKEKETEKRRVKSKAKAKKTIVNESDSDQEVGQFGLRKKLVRKAKIVTPEKSSSSSESDSEDDFMRSRKVPIPYVEECVFKSEQWLAKDEGDGKVERQLLVTRRNMKTKQMNVPL